MGQMNGLVIATEMNTLFGRTARLLENVQTGLNRSYRLFCFGKLMALMLLAGRLIRVV